MYLKILKDLLFLSLSQIVSMRPGARVLLDLDGHASFALLPLGRLFVAGPVIFSAIVVRANWNQIVIHFAVLVVSPVHVTSRPDLFFAILDLASGRLR